MASPEICLECEQSQEDALSAIWQEVRVVREFGERLAGILPAEGSFDFDDPAYCVRCDEDKISVLVQDGECGIIKQNINLRGGGAGPDDKSTSYTH